MTDQPSPSPQPETRRAAVAFELALSPVQQTRRPAARPCPRPRLVGLAAVDNAIPPDQQGTSRGSDLAQWLVAQGFSSDPALPLRWDLDPAGLEALHKLVESYCWLKQQREENVVMVERAQNELNESLGKEQSLKQELMQVKDRLMQVEHGLRMTNGEHRKEMLKMKSMLQQVQKKYAMLQSLDRQYKNELRKKENAYAKLQDRLNALMADRSKQNKMKMVCSGPVRAKRQVGSGNSHESLEQSESQVRELVGKYEKHILQINEENNELRSSLEALYREVEDVLKSGRRMENERDEQGDEQGRESDRTLNEDVFKMPFGLVQDTIETAVLSQAQRARELLQQGEDETNNELEWLRTKVEQQEKIIRKQQVILQGALFNDPGDLERDLLEESHRASLGIQPRSS